MRRCGAIITEGDIHSIPGSVVEHRKRPAARADSIIKAGLSILDNFERRFNLEEPRAPSHLAFVFISSTESHIRRLSIGQFCS